MVKITLKREQQPAGTMADGLIQGAAEYAYHHPVFSGETSPILDSTMEAGGDGPAADVHDLHHLDSQSNGRFTSREQRQLHMSDKIALESTRSQQRASSGSDRLSGNGLDVLGRGVKELVQAVQSLRELGIENLLPLPKIVVVGGQSAGKSSLIEGISEIKVPRDAGCCTRVIPRSFPFRYFSLTHHSVP